MGNPEWNEGQHSSADALIHTLKASRVGGPREAACLFLPGGPYGPIATEDRAAPLQNTKDAHSCLHSASFPAPTPAGTGSPGSPSSPPCLLKLSLLADSEVTTSFWASAEGSSSRVPQQRSGDLLQR